MGTTMPAEIATLVNLEYLYLGQNKLQSICKELCLLSTLKLLNLNNNQLTALPLCLSKLSELKTLHLHYNKIQIVPRQIVQNLREISLRGNPLVNRFVKQRLTNGIRHTPPSLFELAARSIKVNKVNYDGDRLAPHIIKHLECSKKCTNPQCNGVYF